MSELMTIKKKKKAQFIAQSKRTLYHINCIRDACRGVAPTVNIEYKGINRRGRLSFYYKGKCGSIMK